MNAAQLVQSTPLANGFQLTLRDARPTDWLVVQAVTLLAHGELAESSVQARWAAYRQDLVAVLENDCAAARIVAERNGMIVGSVLLYPAGLEFDTSDGLPAMLPHPEIALLSVIPAARGWGVARLLLMECLRRARLSGAKRVNLHVMSAMREAIRLFEHFGFERTARDPNLPPDTHQFEINLELMLF
jgi:ribosomal protein S18 acetylase RimI-like enzyme